MKRTGLVALVGILVAGVSLVAALSFGSSFAVADRTGDSSSFGIGEKTSSTSAEVGVLHKEVEAAPANDSLLQVTSETSALQRGTDFDVMVGVYQIERQREEERRAAEEAARIEEQQRIQQAAQNYQAWQGLAASDGSAGTVSGLSAVDWTVGKAKFIETWTERIDDYLAGSHLAGYGSVFAEAAWDNGVDPRWSPAISNTESGKGRACFLPHNAWGWGQSAWSSWSEAINSHVAGLASGYGYSITLTYAGIYCPPNTANWFQNTVNEMKRI